MQRPRELAPDDLLSASWLNSLLRYVMRRFVIRFLPPLYAKEVDGVITVTFSGPQEAYFKITSGTNPYAGTEQQAGSAGTWANLTGGRTPTTSVDPLYEATGNAAVPANRIVLARRATATSSWIFYASACS